MTTTQAKLWLAGSTLALLTASAAYAQTADGADRSAASRTTRAAESQALAGFEGDILVTARRREESLLDVPVAVTAMTAQTLEATGVRDFKEIASFTPGLNAEGEGTGGLPDRSANRLVFRGLSTTYGSIFINGAPYTGTDSPDITDIERFEVLTGPQSVYFGRSTFSGAVNYVTKAPSDTLSGRLSAEVGTDGYYEFRGAIEGPVIPGGILNARLAARHYQFAGQYRSAVSQMRLGEQKTQNISLALSSEPDPDLHISVYYSFSQDKDGQPATSRLRTYGTNPALSDYLGGVTTGDGLFTPPGIPNPYWLGKLPDLGGLDPAALGDNIVFNDFVRRIYVDNESKNPLFGIGPYLDQFGLKRRIHHVNTRIDWDIAGGWQASILGSLTTIRTTNIRALMGADTSNIPMPAFFPLLFAVGQNDTLSLSAIDQQSKNDAFGEIRVSSPQDAAIRGTIGASYFETWGKPTAGFGITNVGVRGPFGSGGTDEGNKTPAVFGGLYVNLAEGLTLGAEGRMQWDRISEENVLATPGEVLTKTFKSFSPRLTVDYKINPAHMIYATFSRGSNPGGFNTALLAFTPAQLALLPGGSATLFFDEEKLTNFEIGHKGRWADGQLRTTLAAFYMKLRNGQVSNIQFVDGTLVNVVNNLGKIDLWGAEFTGDLFVNDNLSISATVNYNDNKIKQYTYPDGLLMTGESDVAGNNLDHVSKLKFSLSPTLHTELGNGWRASLRVDWLYRSKFYIEPTNTAYIRGRHQVNARLGLEVNDGLSLELWAKNLLNDKTLTEGVRAPETLYSVAPPAYVPVLTQMNNIHLGLPSLRTFGAKLSARF